MDIAKHWPVTISFSLLTALILLGVSIAATSNLKARRPSRFQCLVEIAIDGLRNVFMSALGEGGERHLPLAYALFFYIFFCNMLELLPGYKAATADPSNTLAMGIIVFFYVQYWGIRANGIVQYLKHFVGPLLILAPLFIVIEIIGEFAKPFSLGMRLFGNIYGEDYMNDLATKAGAAHLFIPWQLPVYFLQIFTGAIQAFIFALLTCSYIAIMTEHHDDSGDAHERHPHKMDSDEMAAISMSGLGGSVKATQHK